MTEKLTLDNWAKEDEAMRIARHPDVEWRSKLSSGYGDKIIYQGKSNTHEFTLWYPVVAPVISNLVVYDCQDEGKLFRPESRYLLGEFDATELVRSIEKGIEEKLKNLQFFRDMPASPSEY